jgi:hypothetical protein
MLRMTIISKRTAADERMVSNVTNKIVFISSVRMRQVTVFEERVRDEDRSFDAQGLGDDCLAT